MDSDGQHPPALLPEMVRLWAAGNDIVSTIRRKTEGSSLFKRITSRLFYWTMNCLSDTQLVLGAADFCRYRVSPYGVAADARAPPVSSRLDFMDGVQAGLRGIRCAGAMRASPNTRSLACSRSRWTASSRFRQAPSSMRPGWERSCAFSVRRILVTFFSVGPCGANSHAAGLR